MMTAWCGLCIEAAEHGRIGTNSPTATASAAHACRAHREAAGEARANVIGFPLEPSLQHVLGHPHRHELRHRQGPGSHLSSCERPHFRSGALIACHELESQEMSKIITTCARGKFRVSLHAASVAPSPAFFASTSEQGGDVMTRRTSTVKLLSSTCHEKICPYTQAGRGCVGLATFACLAPLISPAGPVVRSGYRRRPGD